MADRIGQQLGSYRLTRLLGRGGFADVYQGEHVYLKTRAAVKVLQTRLSNEGDLESFLNEARTIAHLSHPNIVRVLDFGVADETLFLVMDYVPNGTLRQRHRGMLLPITTIVPYVKHISAALQYAHDKKLVHRDVKPENMLLGERNEVLLSDFGIALIAQSSRFQGLQQVVGTVAYMSPEQIRGKPCPASDQYSLGIVVYEWLCGYRPFQGSFTELCTQQMFASPPPLKEKVPTIDPAIEQVVNIVLAKDPKERFKSVTAFANALSQAASGQAVLPIVYTPQPLDRSPSISLLSSSRQALGGEPGSVRPESTIPAEGILSDHSPSISLLPSSPQAPPGGELGALRPDSTIPAEGMLFSHERSTTPAPYSNPSETPRNVAFPSLQKRRPGRRFSWLMGGIVGLVLLLLVGLIITIGPIIIHMRGERSPVTRTLPGQILWTFSTGWYVYSSPAVVDGVLYVGSSDRNVYALDASTGQQRWAFPTYDVVYSSPTVVDGVLYVGSNDHNVYAIDANTGQQKWTFATAGVVYSSPTVVNGVLYVGSSDHNVYALDANTGQYKWTFHTGDAVWSSPVVVNGVLYVGSDDHDVYALDASTGQYKWKFLTGDGAPLSPRVVNGVLYVGSSDHKMYALDANTGQKKWTFSTGDGVPSSPSVVNRVLYVGSSDHKVYALDASTGRQKWTFLTGDAVRSSPVVIDGVLYVGSDDHKVYAIDANTGRQKWAFLTGSAVASSPTVANGVLYVGSGDGKVYALTLSTSSS